MALLTRLSAVSSYSDGLPALVLIGGGLGLFTSPMVATAMRTVPPDQAGLASGVNNPARAAGTAIGIAIFGALAGGRGG